MAAIVIANLGTGNLHSVQKAVEFVSAGVGVSVSSDSAEIAQAGHLILPGQGAIGTWMRQLQQDATLKLAIERRLADGPVLGICLGLQALFDASDESDGVEGLGLMPGNVHHFTKTHRCLEIPPVDRLKIPHMGWNHVRQKRQHPLWHKIVDQSRFYFVHSYFVDAANPDQIAGECEYGNTFTAAATKNNIFATQFHPEKSQQVGLQLLRNFINWNGTL